MRSFALETMVTSDSAAAGLLVSNLFANLTETSGEMRVSVAHNVAARAVARLTGKNGETGQIVKVARRTDLTAINAPIVIAPQQGRTAVAIIVQEQ